MSQKTKDPSKAMKVRKLDVDYIKDTQKKFRCRTPQEAISLICRAHQEVSRTPIERAQHKIVEAADLLEDDGQRRFLALVNRILSEDGRALDPAKDALVDIIDRIEHVKAMSTAETIKEDQ
jgi:hypothetical protein